MKIVVLGAGPGGYVAAIRSAQLGAQVTVVEAHEVGGTCLHRGCIPTKALLASAHAYSLARDIQSFGIDLEGTLSPNMRKIMERKRRIVSTLAKGIGSLFSSRGISLRTGSARFVSPREVTIEGGDGSSQTLTADAFIVATGSRPAGIPSVPFDGNAIISSTEALELTERPGRLLIIGAGYIGCEFGGLYQELGSQVTIVDIVPRVVHTEDDVVSSLLQREMKKRKVALHLGVSVERIEREDSALRAFLSDGKEVPADKVLVAVGREFNSADLGLENAGVRTGGKGEIIVNGKMQTNVPHIYAVGDITGVLLLAHVASRQGICAAENIMGAASEVDYATVPSAIFTSPEIASVGLRERQAQERNLNYVTGEFPFRALGRAQAMGEISGTVRVVAEAKTDRILGAHIIGPRASDLIHEFALAMRKGLTVRDISETIHAHPTLSEALMEACDDVRGMAIHIPGMQRN